MVSIKQMANDLDLDSNEDLSILGDFFGFYRRKVPTHPDPTVVAQVSLLKQANTLQGNFFNWNVIKVGRDLFIEPDEIDKIDFAVFRTREIYNDEGMGVGRVQHYKVDSVDSNGLHIITSAADATELTQDWTVPNDGLDVFFVHSITADFVGISNTEGPCDKNANERNGSITDKVRNADKTARTCAHEIGHYIGLSHENDLDDNLMCQTKFAASDRFSVNLTSAQNNNISDHCSIINGI